MALVSRRDDDWDRGVDSWWKRHSDDWFDRRWHDWPVDWPAPRDVFERFHRDSDRWWRDWPADWPRLDTAVMPRFTSALDRINADWRRDPFWRDLYPRWAEPVFKDGIDVSSHIANDRDRFAIDVDCYQFRPEEIQVKTADDLLVIEGRHEEQKDAENFTKMYFVRKYQLPADVDPRDVQSQIDSQGRLTVEAKKRVSALPGERLVPIESGSKSAAAAQPSPRGRHDSGLGGDRYSPLHVDATRREQQREQEQYRSESRQSYRQTAVDHHNNGVSSSPTTNNNNRSRSAAAVAAHNQWSDERDREMERLRREVDEAREDARRARLESEARANGAANGGDYVRTESRRSYQHREEHHGNGNGRAIPIERESGRRSGASHRDEPVAPPRSDSRASGGLIESLRDKFEKNFGSSRRESKTDYRVETPASTTALRLDARGDPEEGTLREERVHRVEIRRNYN